MNASKFQEAPCSGVDVIKSMSRRDFVSKFLEDVSLSEEFGLLVTYYAEHISLTEKLRAREMLHKLGIPYEFMNTDDELDDIAAAAMRRALLRH